MYSHLSQLDNVVALGGGHGLGRLLSALAFLEEKLTGIVATTDNGGSTGRIRAQQGGIAWGDLRNCLSQITPSPTVASMLFEHRFSGSGELAGHNLGNLMLKALEDMQIRPLDGINLVREMLQVKAQIIPMSEQPVHLAAQLRSGSTIIGEISVDALTEVPNKLLLIPEVSATPEAIRKIATADLILLGPGSFFTSIMPALLIPELALAIRQSQAKIIFIDNIGQEHDPSGTLSLMQRVQWLERYIGEKRLNGIITMREPIAALPHLVQLQKNLRADDIDYRHDRNKLCAAIDEIAALFSL